PLQARLGHRRRVRAQGRARLGRRPRGAGARVAYGARRGSGRRDRGAQRPAGLARRRPARAARRLPHLPAGRAEPAARRRAAHRGARARAGRVTARSGGGRTLDSARATPSVHRSPGGRDAMTIPTPPRSLKIGTIVDKTLGVLELSVAPVLAFVVALT